MMVVTRTLHWSTLLVLLMVCVANTGYAQWKTEQGPVPHPVQKISTYDHQQHQMGVEQAGFVQRAVNFVNRKKGACQDCQTEVVYEVPEIQFGRNAGYPQFGEVTHGVWYNGPKYGPGQGSKLCLKRCRTKKCGGKGRLLRLLKVGKAVDEVVCEESGCGCNESLAPHDWPAAVPYDSGMQYEMNQEVYPDTYTETYPMPNSDSSQVPPNPNK